MSKLERQTLQQSLVAMARGKREQFAFADSSGAQVTFGQALVKAVFLTGRLEPVWRGREKVGILVPPSVGGVLVNWAALLMGKIPVNLNFTASQSAVQSAIKQADLDKFITADPFVRKVPTFPWPPNRNLLLIERILLLSSFSLVRLVRRIVSLTFSL